MQPFLIKGGDILIAMSGATTGKIGYYNYEVDYVGDYEDETTATYTYDAIGRRASKKVDGATTTHR